MRDEIAGIGATTPHELMRAVEVSFIRDCAEMAARSSLTRTESRWGLYHDRSDIPERDDVDWRYHLNLRKTADGDIEFLKRPVAPYFVPVPGLDELPSGETEPIAVRQPDLVGGQAPASEVSRVRDGAAAQPPSPRIAAVLALDEPTIEELAPFLADADPGVRRTAVDVLTEHLPDGYASALRRRAERRRMPRCAGSRPTASANSSRCCPTRRPFGSTCRLRRPGRARRRRLRAEFAPRRRRRSSTGARSPTRTTGCGSRRSARWSRSTTPTGWPPPTPTPTAKCASPSRTGSARCAPGRHRPQADRRPRPAGAGRRAGGHRRSIGWDDADVTTVERRSPRRRGRSGRVPPGLSPGRRRRSPRCRRCRGRCPTRTSTSARPRS